MAIEIVDFPMKNGDFPLLCDSSPEGILVELWVARVEISCGGTGIVLCEIHGSIDLEMMTCANKMEPKPSMDWFMGKF